MSHNEKYTPLTSLCITIYVQPERGYDGSGVHIDMTGLFEPPHSVVRELGYNLRITMSSDCPYLKIPMHRLTWRCFPCRSFNCSNGERGKMKIKIQLFVTELLNFQQISCREMDSVSGRINKLRNRGNHRKTYQPMYG